MIESTVLKVIFPVVKSIVSIFKISKTELEKNYFTFRLFKRWNLEKLRNEFLSIYFHSLYNLAENKPEGIIKLFALKEVVDAFKKQFEEKSDWTFKAALISGLHTNPDIRVLKSENVDIQLEIDEFIIEFKNNINKSRTPSSIEQFQLAKKTGEHIGEIKDLSKKIDATINPHYDPIIDPLYISRTEEDQLFKIIDSNSALLLAGISFCGKSQIANKISSRLVDNGYGYMSSSDVGEAERFLRNTNKPKVFLLEDPFGHNSESEIPSNWRRVSELIKIIPSPHKLIITSRTEVIKSINSVQTLDECSIENSEWIDLTCNDRPFLLETWTKLCETNKFPETSKEKIDVYLKSVDINNIIQIGQLKHLARTPQDKLKSMSLDELLYTARADSRDISLDIKNRGKSLLELFMSLGLGSTTNIAINFDELSYIYNKSNYKIGYLEREDPHTFSYNNKDNKAVFPEYKKGEETEKGYLDDLSFLQSRGFVKISNRTVWFSHPTYREAARYILFVNNIGDLDRLDHVLGKSLSTLNPKTSINCANQLTFIYHNTLNGDLKELIKDHSFEASLYSIFPGVRDSCYSFLLEILEDLSEEQKDKVLNRLQTKFTNSEIAWYNNTPFFVRGYISFLDDFQNSITESNSSEIIKNLNSGTFVSASEIWNFFNHFKKVKNPTLMNKKATLNILNFDEVFIRNRMASFVMKKIFSWDKEILDVIFSDNHPSVVFEGVKGAMIGFPDYNKDEQVEVMPYLINALENSFVAIRANNLFSTFGVDYGSESIKWNEITEERKGTIWKLWAQLFPIFLENYPKNLRFANSGRFGFTLEESVNYIDENQGLKIAEAFFQWVNNFHKLNSPDTFEFGVLQYLLKSVSSVHKERINLFKKIFLHQDTSFLVYSLSHAISYWRKLSTEEKSIIITLIRSNRKDQIWIKAVSITQHETPKEIQEAIFNSSNFFNQEISEIVIKMDSKLLEYCLKVYCGSPYLLSSLSLNNNSIDLWMRIMKWVLQNEYSVGFEITLKEFLSSSVNGFSQIWKEDGLVIWQHLCKQSENKKRLADRLIYETATTNCNITTTKDLWDVLIQSYGENLQELVNMITTRIQALQNYNPNDIFVLFSSDFLLNHILPKLGFDNLIVKLDIISRSDETISSTEMKQFSEDLIKISKEQELKIDHSYKVIERNIIQYPFLKSLQINQNLIKEEGQIIIEEMSKRLEESEELPYWNYTSKTNPI